MAFTSLTVEAPTVGKVTASSIDLSWPLDPLLAGTSAYRFYLQQNDSGYEHDWRTVYSGVALKTTVIGLEPSKVYRFRLRLVQELESTPFTPVVTVQTSKKTLNGDDLHHAVLSMDLKSLKEIMVTGHVNINVPDKMGFSPLMNACQKGFLTVAEDLISLGADVNFVSTSGKTPLIVACFSGHLALVQLLLSNGANLHYKDHSGAEALHWATDCKDATIIDELLAKGADPNVLDRVNGWTPLLRTVAVSGNVNIAEALILGGASVHHPDCHGSTPLMIATLNNQPEMLELLIRNGADVNVKTSHGKTAVDFARSMTKDNLLAILVSANQMKQ